MDISSALNVSVLIETSTFDIYSGIFYSGTETSTFCVYLGILFSVTETSTCEDFSGTET